MARKMADKPDARRARCLCLDIETARQDRTALRELGAFRPDTDARLRIAGRAADFVARLDAITEGAAFVLGHNIATFDQPVLAQLYPTLALHRLPLVDTLLLSPVAFPQNPYHRLVKDYKLCTTTRNDPVRDAELAHTLFADEHAALQARVAADPDEALCLHFLLSQENGKGVANLFATLRRSLRPSLDQAVAAWQRTTAGKVCITAGRHLIDQWLPDPAWHTPLAYVLAWLRVAGGNSVLPPWVAKNFPQTRQAIAALRDTPCNDPDCTWCREQHDIATLLPRYFPGITRFRSTPTTPDGQSLQQAIVANGFAGTSSLAILPTGGGKSLCFQLPALARYYRNGSLTVVVSPLQSLMKDQVDNLEARGITCAGYLNGLLTPIERKAMLDKLRLGDLGLIFVAPEQFRGTAFIHALAQREIAAWVFDEAHCLSKWGHDFRPDYLYVSRFIRRMQGEQPSPVFCFTATAKPEVIADICSHVDKHLGLTLARLEGGVSRHNLDYEVRAIPVAAKYGETLRLLGDALQEEGSAIVFCSRQKAVEEVSRFLQEGGLDCAYFHGGMPATDKRAVQEAFLAGTPRVIAATNAFGMGVDKPDVRLVIHLDTPGSLENYLQEAGRAGRDQAPARCVLLYDEADLDVQFRLLKNARLTQHDIHSILKALRTIERRDRSDGEVVVTTGEILLEIPESYRLDPDAHDSDTKVRVAIAWLEEARLLQRHENHARVFPGSLLVGSVAEAEEKLRRHLGPDADPGAHLRILSLLIQAGDDEGLSTDELMLATGLNSRDVRARLREMDHWQLLSNDVEIGVTLYRDPDSAQRLATLARIEDALLAILREAAPEAADDGWQMLNMRRLCDVLRRESQVDFDPGKLTRLLKSFAEPFGDGTGQRGFFALRPAGMDSRAIRLLRSWREIDQIRQRRMGLARALLNHFVAQRQGNNLLITCKQGELEAALQADITLASLDIQKWDVALSAALLYLDTNEVLHLARGKAVFRAAMRIKLNPEARRRQFSKTDYAELALHYKDKIVQVHVMAEYARLAVRKIQAAMAFVVDYFHLDRAEFIRRYFAGRKDVLEMATTEAAHRRILTSLENPDQQAIVAAAQDANYLVLAGPGAGKTRVIVHRVAWLLRESMALPEEILVLTYNRAAAIEIRRRLWALIGADAAGVAVQTLHGLAMRLTGTSYAVALERGETVDFDAVIRHATERLIAAEAGDGVGPSIARDRMLAGLRHLLVDEYQDINGDHYALISALAGRRLQTEEDRLSLLVVGDDDQNIYAFDGASVRYIRQFEHDYQARRFTLVENYRSTAHIIHCANQLIAPAAERMKAGQAIRVNHARQRDPDGGEWARRDPLGAGRVMVLEVPPNPSGEAAVALAELQRRQPLAADGEAGAWGDFAVIGRRWEDLETLAAHCRQAGVPVHLVRDSNPIALHITRQGHALLRLLEGRQRRTGRNRVLLGAGTLGRWFRRRFGKPADGPIEHPFEAALAQFILDTERTAPGCERVVVDLIESLYDFGAGTRTPAGQRRNAPLVLMTAHRAKGLEFPHVLVLDGGGWQGRGEDERRLYYVAMTRARHTLTLCERIGAQHPFVAGLDGLTLRARLQPPAAADNAQSTRIWQADPSQIVLSWPAHFAAFAPIHRHLAALDVGSPLRLQRRPDKPERWEITDAHGVTVTRMASRFAPPAGAITAVRVAAIVVRQPRKDETGVRVAEWELVLPEIEYRPAD